jgi:hypothetical protein
MPIADYYSTPADVRALIAMMLQLGLKAQTVRVQNNSGSWQTPATLPVNLPDLEEGKADIYSVTFGDDTTDAQNVAALLRQARTMQMPPLYRAWYVYCQVTGQMMPIEQFQGHLDTVAAIKNAWQEKLAEILEGK